LHLLRRLPARHRHDCAAKTLGAVVSAETAGEQTIPICDVNDVARATAGRTNRPRHEQGPGVYVLRGITDNRRLAGRAARRMHTHDFVARHSEHPEGIVGAQIVLHRERKLREIVEGAEVVRMNTRDAKALAIVRHIFVRVLHRPFQPLQLQRTQLVDAGRLDRLQALRLHDFTTMLPPISCERPRNIATHSPR
jgi:hypothetical protein